MPSTKLSLRTTDLDMAQAVSDALSVSEPELDAVTLFEDGPGAWRVEAYAQERADAEAAAEAVRRDHAQADITLEDLEDLNWVAISQAALPPVYAGRFVVHGSHDRGRVPHGPWAIEVEAGEAFGTAHHATTLGCLKAIDALARRRQYKRVLDLGCGSGILAIAAARALPRAQVIATDNDPIAVEVARSNADANGAKRIVTACADGLRHPWLRHAAPFDLVIANILAGPLRMLAGDISGVVSHGANLVLSGILTPEAPTVIAAYAAQGFTLVEHRRIAEWSTLTLVRR
jgi:ribosomal protein L11 methyltransferase